MSEKVGPGQPPRKTQFQKGKSGNPGGRPPKKSQESVVSAFGTILEKTLTATMDGIPRELTADEALQQSILKRAFAGDGSAQREILKMIVKREEFLVSRQTKSRSWKVALIVEKIDPTNADQAMLLLDIADRDPDRQDFGFAREQLRLQPWAVQAALSRRRGGQRLTAGEVAEIRRRTYDSENLKWPRSMSD